ncbi:hypothetical protein ACXN5S_00185 [Pseudoroseicyclus sp. H15]
MPRFIFTYHGGRKDMTPEEVSEGRQRWMDWIADLGESAVEPNNPLKAPRLVGDDQGITPMMGYTVIRAGDAAEAEEMAEGCPFLDMGGTIMVAEILEMQ